MPSRPCVHCMVVLLRLLIAVFVAARGVDAGDLSSPQPETLILDSGDRLTGQSRSVEDGYLRWAFSSGSELMIPLDGIERIEFTQPAPPTPAEPFTEPEPRWTDRIPFRAEISGLSVRGAETVRLWTQRIQFGGQFLDGNAQADLIDLMSVFERNTPQQMRQLDFGGQWGRNNSRETANRWFLNSNFDRPLDPEGPWITFITSKNEYNGLANLDYRGTVSAGFGYRFYFEAKKRLIIRAGPAYTVEFFHDPKDHRESPDFFGELELKWPLFERTTLEQKMRVQPSVLDVELVRVFSTTGLMVDLDERDRWKLRLGLQYTYNSQPNAGKLPNDFISTVSLVYQRK